MTNLPVGTKSVLMHECAYVQERTPIPNLINIFYLDIDKENAERLWNDEDFKTLGEHNIIPESDFMCNTKSKFYEGCEYIKDLHPNSKEFIKTIYIRQDMKWSKSIEFFDAEEFNN